MATHAPQRSPSAHAPRHTIGLPRGALVVACGHAGSSTVAGERDAGCRLVADVSEQVGSIKGVKELYLLSGA